MESETESFIKNLLEYGDTKDFGFGSKQDLRFVIKKDILDELIKKAVKKPIWQDIDDLTEVLDDGVSEVM